MGSITQIIRLSPVSMSYIIQIRNISALKDLDPQVGIGDLQVWLHAHMLYLVVVADGVTLHPALHLDGERQVSVDVVNQRLEGAWHQPELLRKVASKNARLEDKSRPSAADNRR